MFYNISIDNVAPYTGAWIEINALRPNFTFPIVAPYTGAWIEIILLRLHR